MEGKLTAVGSTLLAVSTSDAALLASWIAESVRSVMCENMCPAVTDGPGRSLARTIV